MTDQRMYRFAPRDSTGWILGLGATQTIALVSGAFGSGLLLNAKMPLTLVLVPFITSVVFAFARFGGKALHAHVPSQLRWIALCAFGLRQWSAQPDQVDELPPFLCGFEVIEVPAPAWVTRIDDGGIAMVLDHRDHTISATLPVRSRHFALCDRGDQERLLEGWGDVLGAFGVERGPVCRVTWSERAARSAASNVAAHRLASSDASAASYLDLVSSQAREAVLHESAVTVTVDLRRVRKGTGPAGSLDAGKSVLAEELGLLAMRLSDAGHDVDVPLSAAELHHAVRARLDPRPDEPIGGRSLAQLTCLDVPAPGPRNAVLEWNWVRVDGSLHLDFSRSALTAPV